MQRISKVVSGSGNDASSYHRQTVVMVPDHTLASEATHAIKLSLLFAMAFAICHLGGESLKAAEHNYALEDSAMHQATAAVAESVVQIRTVGGLDRIGKTQLSQGPLTGLVVTADGYIVSSAFNFAQQPSSILVRLPNGKQVPAELVARDLNRMLVLLKVESDQPLPVPTAVPTEKIAVGQWAIALGRTFQTDKVDVSLGIISALDRMHGRVVQTDANISAANYGGPLVDIYGRVFGVLVPMSPQGGDSGPENAIAGAEFYDSGIGFAVPLEHVFSMLDRWHESGDLLPGKLGVGLKSGSPYIEPPTITTVWPGSPAAEAGWQPNDTIIAAEGKAIATQSQLQFLLKPRYAGDKLTLSLRRGAGETAEEFDSEITLAGKLAPYRHSFLGILPAAYGESEGVLVAEVWPKSPAEVAGIQAEDRITKIGSTDTSTIPAAWGAMQNLQPDETVEVSLQRGDEELSVQAKLATLPELILAKSQLGSSTTPTTEEAKPLEPQLLKLPEFPQEAHYLHPKLPDPQRAGLLIWLGTGKDDEETAMFDAWQKVCQQTGTILLVARPGSEAGWQSDDLEYLKQLSRLASIRFRPHPRQTILGGQDKGGQLAYALAFKNRSTFSGVIADNAPLPRTLEVPDNSPSGQLAVLSILPTNSNFASLVKHDNEQLRHEGYPVSQIDREAGLLLDDATIATIGRWIAGLNRF